MPCGEPFARLRLQPATHAERTRAESEETRSNSTSRKLTSWPVLTRLKLEMPIMTSFCGATRMSSSSKGLLGLCIDTCRQGMNCRHRQAGRPNNRQGLQLPTRRSGRNSTHSETERLPDPTCGRCRRTPRHCHCLCCSGHRRPSAQQTQNRNVCLGDDEPRAGVTECRSLCSHMLLKVTQGYSANRASPPPL